MTLTDEGHKFLSGQHMGRHYLDSNEVMWLVSPQWCKDCEYLVDRARLQHRKWRKRTVEDMDTAFWNGHVPPRDYNGLRGVVGNPGYQHPYQYPNYTAVPAARE